MPKYKDDEYTEVEDIKLQNDYFENLDKNLIYNYLDQTENDDGSRSLLSRI